MASSRTFINFGRRYPDHVVFAVIFRDYARQFLDVHDIEKGLLR